MKYYFHPKDGSYPFKVEYKDKSVVYATDVEQYIGGDHRLINFAKDCHSDEFSPYNGVSTRFWN